MKRKNVVALTLMFLLAAGAFLLFVPGPQASAQQNCTEIRALLQLTLPSSYMLAPATDVWGGPAFATLGGEPLVGGISGNDGEGFRHGARGGQYQVYLCSTNLYPKALELPPACQDSFTYEVPTSVFGSIPGKAGLGKYQGNTAKIISGTGKFADASGNLNVAGPYIVWEDSNSLFGVSGRGNLELSGKICGVQ